MKNWLVFYTVEHSDATEQADEQLAAFPSTWCLMIWLVRFLRKCVYIRIIREPIEFKTTAQQQADPCEFCLRWEECNGVDIEFCSK